MYEQGLPGLVVWFYMLLLSCCNNLPSSRRGLSVFLFGLFRVFFSRKKRTFVGVYRTFGVTIVVIQYMGVPCAVR